MALFLKLQSGDLAQAQKPTLMKGKTLGSGANWSHSRELTWFQRPICTPLIVSA